jgi:shikimate kinase
VLIGLPGAGKTEVGRLLARRLGTEFTDLDDVIVARTGKSVAQLFAARGEAAFRELEREAMLAVLAREPHVVAPGGGWAVQPGNLEAALDAVLVVHLRVEPATAAERVGVEHGRPLLGSAPGETLGRLAAERVAWYGRAHHAVETDGLTPEQAAETVADLARRHAGW